MPPSGTAYGSSDKPRRAATASPRYAPFADPGLNPLYNMLFCEDPLLASFVPQWMKQVGRFLGVKPESSESIRARAENLALESRERATACGQLRLRGEPVPDNVFFGLVTEVGRGELDTAL